MLMYLHSRSVASVCVSLDLEEEHAGSAESCFGVTRKSNVMVS